MLQQGKGCWISGGFDIQVKIRINQVILDLLVGRAFQKSPLHYVDDCVVFLLQVDFDDGNCPTYHNQIKGIYNVYRAVHNQFPSEFISTLLPITHGGLGPGQEAFCWHISSESKRIQSILIV